MSRIVVALGGNALGNSPQEQLKLVKNTADALVNLIVDGHELIICHGNGPQVGMINLAMETSTNVLNSPVMPFAECGAMSQGYIGFHLQNAIQQSLKKQGLNKSCASVITQVVVDKNDSAFSNPTKPIGAFYEKEEALKMAKEQGFTVKEDANRGYRRVIASPKPLEIIEKDFIKSILDAGNIPIICGGGGISVYQEGNEYLGIDSVIDKDFASELAAEVFNADILVVLTAVEHVAVNFGKENQIDLEEITVDQALKYIDEGQFAPGSMLPKVEASIKFASAKEGNISIIASLEKAAEALRGKSGTRIIR